MLTPVEAFLEHDPKIPYDNSGTEWHISYYSEEDRKRIDTVMQSYGCENYTLHPDIAQCIETFKKWLIGVWYAYYSSESLICQLEKQWMTDAEQEF